MLQKSLRWQILLYSVAGLLTAVVAITLYSAISLRHLGEAHQTQTQTFFTHQLLTSLEYQLAHEAQQIAARVNVVAGIAQGLADTQAGLLLADAAT